MSDPDCLICTMEETPDERRILIDDLWAAEVAPGYEVPGWFFLRARRHAEKITALSTDELASFGRHAQELTAAVEQATGAPAVYLLSFGESYQHFHALVAARGEDIPADLRGGAMLQLLATHRDPAEAVELAGRVRDAYDANARNRQPAEIS